MTPTCIPFSHTACRSNYCSSLKWAVSTDFYEIPGIWGSRKKSGYALHGDFSTLRGSNSEGKVSLTWPEE